MRIALYHNAPSGGAKRAIYEWTARLSSRHTVDVYTLASADHDYCDIRPFVHRHEVAEFRPRRMFESPWGRLNQMQRWRDLGDLARTEERLAATIDARAYDVVFAHSCRIRAIPALMQYLDTPTIFYLHEPFGQSFQRSIERSYSQGSSLREAIDRFDPLILLYRQRLADVQESSVLQTHHLLANSHFTQVVMTEVFGVQPDVSLLGVDTETFRPFSTDSVENVVISVGELSPRKGFDFLVESVGLIPEDRRPSLRIVCNRVEPAERAYIENLSVHHNVELEILENLSAEDLAVHYNRAKCCVYSPVLEPFGLVPLEAMACGTPVVGVREGGVEESVVHRETGLLAERDAVEFSEAVQYLLQNPGIAAEYGNNARKHVLTNWTWDQSTASLERHFQAVAGRSNHAGLLSNSDDTLSMYTGSRREDLDG